MDDVIIARRDIEWAGPSIAVQACESWCASLMEIDGIGGVVARPGAGRPRAWA